MKLRIAAAALLLAACDGGRGSNVADPATNATAAEQGTGAAQANSAVAPPSMPACPFRETEGWGGAIEGGRLIVNGVVDLQMAGFRPALTERAGASAGTLALDLALAAEPNAPVSDRVRYERSGASGYRRGEIWCGGERIAEFQIVSID